MKKELLKSAVLVISLISISAYAEGNAEAGKQKSVTCVACHGTDGNSLVSVWPKIAGQGQRYIIEQLKEFKKGPEGARKGVNAIQMYPIVAGLSDQDIEDLAAYYSSQKASIGVTNDDMLEKGRAIYRGGNTDINSAACIACHGARGKGNPAAAFPAVRGQHAEYSYAQLKAFHNGERISDPNSMMRNLVRRMSDEEMRSVAEYMQGLY